MRSLPIVEIPDSSSSNTLSENVQGRRGAYSFISLGCPKNLVDSEQMLGLLQQRGYQLVQKPEDSDFVVINTCGFIENARKESFEAIDQMLELKRNGVIRGVVITGCLAERQNENLLEQRPDIDGLVGVFGRDEIANLVDRIMDGLDEQRAVFKPAPIRALSDHMRLQVTPQHFAYLKISEGCDRLCTFCAIPKMRGKHASKPMDDILLEARRLADNGVRELIIVAQDTTYYGIDMFGEPRLRGLLEELDQVEGLDWIRLMYFYPMYIDKPLLNTIAQAKRILPYIDMPLQHASNPVLKRMARRVTRESTVEMVSMMRETIQNLVLRTTMITGFPGETDEQFEELVEFVDSMNFERLGVFTYSIESDTPASRLDEHLPERIKKERRKRLMAVQQKNAFDWCARQHGKRLNVLLDKPVEGVADSWIGRSYADAPDVDACVFVTPSDGVSLKSGDMVECEIVSSNDYDLVGVAMRVIQ